MHAHHAYHARLRPEPAKAFRPAKHVALASRASARRAVLRPARRAK